MFGEIFGAILLFGGILTGNGGIMQVKCGYIYNSIKRAWRWDLYKFLKETGK